MVDERFLLIASHFWPYADPLSALAVEFARALAEEVGSLTVLTRPAGSKGVAHFRMHGFDIVGVGETQRRPRDRLLDTLRPWGRRGNWSQDVARAVEALTGDTRGAFVFPAAGEERPLVRELRKSPLPAVVRLSAPLPKRAEGGINPRHRFVSPCKVPTGSATVRSMTIPDAVPSRWNRGSRTAVRQALTRAHPILRVKPRETWLICNAPLTDRAGVSELVEQWTMATPAGRSDRLWLTGSGPAGYEIFRRIKRLGMEDRIVMPGQFDTPADLLSACDGVIVPGPAEAIDWFTHSALRFGVPVLIHESAQACWETWYGEAGETATASDSANSRFSIAVYGSGVASLASTLARLESDRQHPVGTTSTDRPNAMLDSISGAGESVREMALRYLELLRTIDADDVGTESGLPAVNPESTDGSRADGSDDA